MAGGRMSVIQGVLKRWANIPTRIVCILVLLFQCTILDYFLVSHNNLVWCLWALPDLIVVGLFIAAFIISYKYLHGKPTNSETRPVEAKVGGELPLGYIAWGVYAVFLSIKIGILFGMPEYIAQKLDEGEFFGPNLLKTTISLSSVIYLMLVVTHHDAKPGSDRQSLIKSMTGGVAVDLLDTTQFLQILFVTESHIFLTFAQHKAILAISCINLVLPTILLLILSRTHYGRGSYPKILKFIHTVLYLLAINLPMLIIRMVLWHVKKQEVSVFAIKNVIGIGQTVLVIHEYTMSIGAATDEPECVDIQPASGGVTQPGEAIPMTPLRPASQDDQHDGEDEV